MEFYNKVKTQGSSSINVSHQVWFQGPFHKSQRVELPVPIHYLHQIFCVHQPSVTKVTGTTVLIDIWSHIVLVVHNVDRREERKGIGVIRHGSPTDVDTPTGEIPQQVRKRQSRQETGVERRGLDVTQDDLCPESILVQSFWYTIFFFSITVL